MKNTKFMNSSGLPDPQHYSTARDLQVLAAALIRDFPAQYGQYYSQKEFRYNNITQPNRNRLLWLDPTVDGVKTGFTEAAGYCLIASSKRGPRRLLSVLLGLDVGVDACPGVAEAPQLGIPVLRRGQGVWRRTGGQGDRSVERRETSSSKPGSSPSSC
jgi:D-alanyl-D-alanine carboxypeptidase